MSRKGRWPGTWRAICDSCGFEFPSDEMFKRWDGFMVCRDDWEQKHPQLDIRIRPERIAPPWVRPEAEDTFGLYCTIISSSAYTGLAQADCALANNTTFSYIFLRDLNDGLEVSS